MNENGRRSMTHSTGRRAPPANNPQRETNQQLGQFIAEQRQTNADQQQDNQRVESKLANLDGDNLERRARESILNIAKDHLDLTRGRVLLSNNRDMDPGLRAAIYDAVEQGLVTDAAASNLEVADVILQGRRGQDRGYIHLTVEISQTIGNNDVRRARERADTLAAATGEEAAAAVIGGVIHPPQQRLALELGVTAATPTMFARAVPE